MSTVGWIMLFFLFLLLFMCLVGAFLQKRNYFIYEDPSRVDNATTVVVTVSEESPSRRLVPYQMRAMQACLWSFEREERARRAEEDARREQKEREERAKKDLPPSYEVLFGNK